MNHSKTGILTLLLAGSMLLSGCESILNIEIGTAAVSETDPESTVDPTRYEITSTDYQTDASAPIEIDLGQVGYNTSNYSWSNTTLIINTAGDYILSGTLDGNILINVFNDETCHLILNGVEITSPGGPAVYIQKAGKTVLTAAEGTENTVSDTVLYTEDNPACIFSNTSLTINGSGILNVYGYYEDAVRSKDLLKVIGTNLYTKSNQDGLRGNDGVIIYNSNTSIESENIGIRSVSTKDMIMINGGTCKIIAGKNAVAANRHVSIYNCQADLYSAEETVVCNGIKDIQEGILGQ